MENPELLKQLEQLDLQIWDITQEVDRLRAIINQLNEAEMDNSNAQLTLSRLEDLLMIYVQEREKLHAEVAKLAGGSSQGPLPSDR
jgi:hypothetical protein